MLRTILFIGLCLATFHRGAWAGPNVLLLWDDDKDTPLAELNANTLALVDEMEAQGLNVTFSANTQSSYTGHNPEASDFDVVVHLNGNINVARVLPIGAVLT